MLKIIILFSSIIFIITEIVAYQAMGVHPQNITVRANSASRSQAYCLQFFQPVPLRTTPLTNVLTGENTTVVIISNKSVPLDKAIKQGVLRIWGGDTPSEVVYENLTDQNIEIQINEPLVLSSKSRYEKLKEFRDTDWENSVQNLKEKKGQKEIWDSNVWLRNGERRYTEAEVQTVNRKTQKETEQRLRLEDSVYKHLIDMFEIDENNTTELGSAILATAFFRDNKIRNLYQSQAHKGIRIDIEKHSVSFGLDIDLAYLSTLFNGLHVNSSLERFEEKMKKNKKLIDLINETTDEEKQTMLLKKIEARIPGIIMYLKSINIAATGPKTIEDNSNLSTFLVYLYTGKMRTQELIPIDGEKTIRNRKFKTFMQVDLIPNERIIQAVIGEKSPGGILRVNTGHKLGKEEDYQNARKKILGEILKLRTLDISAIQSERAA